MQTRHMRDGKEESSGSGVGGGAACDPDVTTGSGDRETETFDELLRIAHRRTGAIPAERVVEKVMAVTRGGDWPLRRAALEALLRRFTFARRDELVEAAFSKPCRM